MIAGLCGFAELLRESGGDVGTAEVVDAARALSITDLSDREAVRRALRFSIAWSAVDPDGFDRLFERWFSGRDLDLTALVDAADRPEEHSSVGLDTDTIDAARIHTEESMAIETDEVADGASDDSGESARTRAPADRSADGGLPVDATGSLAEAAPHEAEPDDVVRRGDAVVDLPVAPGSDDLELARTLLAEAIERRNSGVLVAQPRRARTLTTPLDADEKARLDRVVRRLGRQLDGADSWHRAPSRVGRVDVRRTMRSTVTTGGLPIDLRYAGRRASAARVVVLVDLSLSVRGTARLVLHLVHRMRRLVGSVRAFGFVDSCVPIDRALRVADSTAAIERVFGLVDADANSDPGRALRQWWAHWHDLVTPNAHVLVLGDGRCNGLDPAFEIVSRAARRSASMVWVSPEPVGAWTLGRGEMAEYARQVDRAVSVRSIDDLDRVVAAVGRPDRRLTARSG